MTANPFQTNLRNCIPVLLTAMTDRCMTARLHRLWGLQHGRRCAAFPASFEAPVPAWIMHATSPAMASQMHPRTPPGGRFHQSQSKCKGRATDLSDHAPEKDRHRPAAGHARDRAPSDARYGLQNQRAILTSRLSGLAQPFPSPIAAGCCCKAGLEKGRRRMSDVDHEGGRACRLHTLSTTARLGWTRRCGQVIRRRAAGDLNERRRSPGSREGLIWTPPGEQVISHVGLQD